MIDKAADERGRSHGLVATQLIGRRRRRVVVNVVHPPNVVFDLAQRAKFHVLHVVAAVGRVRVSTSCTCTTTGRRSIRRRARALATRRSGTGAPRRLARSGLLLAQSSRRSRRRWCLRLRRCVWNNRSGSAIIFGRGGRGILITGGSGGCCATFALEGIFGGDGARQVVRRAVHGEAELRSVRQSLEDGVHVARVAQVGDGASDGSRLLRLRRRLRRW